MTDLPSESCDVPDDTVRQTETNKIPKTSVRRSTRARKEPEKPETLFDIECNVNRQYV